MSLNKAMIIGNLGRDPEMRYTPNGQAVTQFTVAVNRNYKDASGEWKEETEWFRVVAWGPLAERTAEYLRKGRKVYVEGRLQTRTWEGQDGQKHYTTELVASTVTGSGPSTARGRSPGARRRATRARRRPGGAVRGSRVERPGRAALLRIAGRSPASTNPIAAPPSVALLIKERTWMPAYSREKPKGKRDDYYRDRRRRKVCTFCADKTVMIDYKEVNRLAALPLRARQDRAAPQDRDLRQSPAPAGRGPQACPHRRPAAVRAPARPALTPWNLARRPGSVAPGRADPRPWLSCCC